MLLDIHILWEKTILRLRARFHLNSTNAENSSGPPNRLVGDLDCEVALGNRVVLLDQDALDLSGHWRRHDRLHLNTVSRDPAVA